MTINVRINQGNQKIVRGTTTFIGSSNVQSQVSHAEQLANSAYITANSALITSQFAYDTANTALQSISIDVNYIQGVNDTQNTNISLSTNVAQNAYNSSNTKLPLTGGEITGSITVDGQANVYQRLAVGTGAYQILPNLIAQFTGTSDLYSQVNQQNLSGKGTGDFVVTADNGSDLVNYLDMGMSGSQYDNTTFNAFPFVNPNDGYFMLVGNPSQNYGGNVFYGTSGSGSTGLQKGDIVFVQGQNFSEVARFKLNQGLVLKNATESLDTTTGTLVVQGGVGVSGNLHAGAVYDGTIRLKTYIDTANSWLQSYITSTESPINSVAQSAYNQANNASANTIYISGVDAVQNTNITNLQTWLNSNNTLQVNINATQNTRITNLESGLGSNVAYIAGIDASQNTNITNLQTWLNSNNTLQVNINATQNTRITNLESGLGANVAYIAGIDATQNTRITNLETGLGSNVAYISGIDNTQNTRITNLESGLGSNVSYISGIDSSQNTRITNLETGLGSNVAYISGIDNTQNTRITNLETGLGSNISYISGIDSSQNTRITNLESGLGSNISYISGIDNTQNTRITNLETGLGSNVAYISGIDNTQNTRITNLETGLGANVAYIAGIDFSQNTRITNLESGLGSNVAYISGIDATQNTNITNLQTWLSSNNTLQVNINATQNTRITNLETGLGSNVAYIAGIDASQNTRLSAVESNLSANITYIQGVDASQNTNLSTANTFLQSNDAVTLSSAKSYTDSANTYLDNKKVNKSGDTINGTLSIINPGTTSLNVTGSVYISNDLSITGNVYIGGNTTSVSANNLIINDPLLYLANNNPANLQDIGLVGHFISGYYQHTGIVRDHADGKWKFFSNVTSEPTNTIPFDTNTIYDTLKVGTIEASSANINNVDLLSFTQSINNNLSANITYISGIDASQNTNITNLQTWLASNNTLQVNINATQNTRITNLETGLGSNVAYISGIDNTQNTRITNLESGLGANVAYISGIDASQNTRITNLETGLGSNVAYIAGIDSSQNTRITNLETGLGANVAYISGIDNTQNTRITNLETGLGANVAYINGIDTSQNTNISNLQTWLSSNISYISGIDNTQNTRITNLETGLGSNISYISGIDNTQNTRITNLETGLGSNVAYISGIDNTQNTRITNLESGLGANVAYIAGIDSSQNTRITNLETGLGSNVAYIAGIDASQNTNITNASNLAQAAYNKANTATALTGLQPNAILFANTSGYTANDASNLAFYSANSTLVASNIKVPTVYTTVGGVVFPDGTTQTTAATGTGIDQVARNIANTKVYAFFQNTAPTTANSHDIWMQSDTGVVYENWGTPSTPVWAEFGPTGVVANTAPGAFAATQANVFTSLYVGGLTPLGGATNPIIGSLGNTNNYIQNYIWNTSNTANASSDFVAYSNNGNDTSGWIDMGITSNAFNQPTYSVTGRNEGYVFMSAPSGSGTSGNLVIATDSTGVYNSIEFVTGGFGKGKGNNAVTIRNNDLIVTGNTTFNGIGGGYAPNRPAFRVYGANTTNNLTTTQNGTGCLTANNWASDFIQGNYLNQTTGIFTAPVSGIYQVNVVGRNSGYTTGISQLAVTKNGTSGGTVGGTVMCMLEFGANSSMNHAGVSASVKMSVGDTLALKVLAGQINFDSNDNWSVAYIG